MLTDEQFDELADKLLKKIAPKLGVELEEEEPKPSTVVRDKDGEEYDLEQCTIVPCMIKVEGTFWLFVEDGIDDSEGYRDCWISSYGDKFSTKELVSVINEYDGNFEVIQD